MRIVKAFASVGLLFVALLSCVGQNSTLTEAQAGKDEAPGTGTIRGCLSGSKGSFVLTQDGTGAMFSLAGSQGQLKDYLNSEVVVTGRITGTNSTNAGQDEGDAPEGGSVRETTSSTVQVTDVKMVAKRCDRGGSSQPTH